MYSFTTTVGWSIPAHLLANELTVNSVSRFPCLHNVRIATLLLSLRWLNIHVVPLKKVVGLSSLVGLWISYTFCSSLALYMVTTVNIRRLEERVGPRGCEPILPDLKLHRIGRCASGLQVDETRRWLISGRISFCSDGLFLSPVVI